MSKRTAGKWCPDECPITGRKFFLWMEHPEKGMVPTYGGPFDSFTLAERDGDNTYQCERYDHDAGKWMDAWDWIDLRLIEGQRDDCEHGEIDKHQAQVTALLAERDALRKDWQSECLKKGFKYVREPDDHYVVADPSEMVSLLRDLLGVDVRTKEGDDYGVSVSELQDQIEGLIDTIHAQERRLEAMKKDAERYRWLRNRSLQVSFSAPAIIMVNDSCEPVSTHAWRSALSGNDADAAIDAALQGEQP